jgi:hypothetical protein
LGDTTPEAAEQQTEALRRLGAVARLNLAVDLSRTARVFLRARLRATYPEWSELELERELLRHTLPEVALPPGLR